MLSPKFKFSIPIIEKHVNSSRIAYVWKSKIRMQLRKQIIWDIIEFKDIDNSIDAFSKEISTDITSASYKVDKPHTYLVEKSRGLCRQMTMVGPKDLVLLQCLSSALHDQIKSKSPSNSAFFEPGDMKWSQGKMTLGDSDYGSIASWKKFQKQILKFRKENKFIVVTDVANFYDFINFRHLRNIISSICDVEEPILDLLIYILNELSWTPDYMPRQEMGMPQIESEAPRVLANAMLYELDRLAEKLAYKNYARFMDDIDCGAGSIVEAKRFVRDVDLTLQSRQLRLNSAKTKILDQKSAFTHFCVRENARLDRYSRVMENAKVFSLLKVRISKRLVHYYEEWLQRDLGGTPGQHSILRQGNGSKIHKRILTLLRRCEVEVPFEDLIWLVKNDPGMRQTAFRHLTYSSKPNQVFYLLKILLCSGLFVDDAAHMDFSNFCIYAKFKKTNKLIAQMRAAAEFLNQCGPTGSYAATVILCRIGDPNDLINQAKFVFRNWPRCIWLCRAIAGFFPLVCNAPSPIPLEFLQLVRSSKDQSVTDVLDHQMRLANDLAYVLKNKTYLSAPNGSFPQKIYFPKALQILSVKMNVSAAPAFVDIASKHVALKADPFYKAWGF